MENKKHSILAWYVEILIFRSKISTWYAITNTRQHCFWSWSTWYAISNTRQHSFWYPPALLRRLIILPWGAGLTSVAFPLAWWRAVQGTPSAPPSTSAPGAKSAGTLVPRELSRKQLCTYHMQFRCIRGTSQHIHATKGDKISTTTIPR